MFEDVVDDLVVTGLDEVKADCGVLEIGKFLAEESLPLLAEDEHEGGVAGWGIDGSKGHDVEGTLNAVRSDEAEFVAVAVADADLVEA